MGSDRNLNFCAAVPGRVGVSRFGPKGLGNVAQALAWVLTFSARRSEGPQEEIDSAR
jgi:hypothetical protein